MSISIFHVQFFYPGLIPDKEVRVSVKALAVSCVGAAAALHPEAFFNSLYLEPLDGIPVEGRDMKEMGVIPYQLTSDLPILVIGFTSFYNNLR